MIILHSIVLECPHCNRQDRFLDNDTFKVTVLSKRGKYKCPYGCKAYMTLQDAEVVTEDEECAAIEGIAQYKEDEEIQ